MKTIKTVGLMAIILALVYYIVFITINVLNSDLYGRLIETQSFNDEKKHDDNLPEVTLILHKYLNEESAIETSIIVTYPKIETYNKCECDSLKFALNVVDGYNYSPHGPLFTFEFKDSIERETYGYTYSNFESTRFNMPVAASINGFPFDNIQILPITNLYLNGKYTDFNFQVQKRIAGRVLYSDPKDKRIIQLIRTPAEQYFVMIGSFIFLLITALLTFGLFTLKKGLSTIEELIAVAGYILATAGFKEILGLSRINGTSALEILVVLIPLLSVFCGLVYSVYMGRKKWRFFKNS